MKRRMLLLLTGLLIGMAGSYWVLHHRERPVGSLTPAADVPPTVTIKDGKTIDFSKGQAEVRDTPEDRAAMAQALREMEAAAEGVTFGPSPPLPPPP